MNERFKELRKALGLTQSEFGKILGLSTSGVSDIESGRRKVTEQHLIMLSNYKNKIINIEWIRTGKGEKFKERSPSDEVGYYVEDLLEYEGGGNPFYDMIIEMMKTYHELDEKSKTVIREYFRNVKNGLKEKEEV